MRKWIKISSRARSSIALLTCVFAQQVSANESNFSASIGSYYSQGSYGAEDPISFETLPDTGIVAFPFSVKYKLGRWAFSLHSAYVNIDGNQSRIFFDDEFEAQSETSSQPHSGFSDLTTKLSYRLDKYFDATYFRVGTKIKLPTSDKSDKLGSGEVDYSFFFNSATRLSKTIFLSNVGFQITGDSPTSHYNNRWYGRASIQRLIAKRFILGGSYYFKQAATETRGPIRKLGLSTTWMPNRKSSYSLLSGFGFSQSSSDWSLGIQSSFKF